QGHRDAEWTRAVFEAEPDLVGFTLLESSGATQWKPSFTVRNSNFLKLYGLKADEIDRIRKEIPIPIERVLVQKSLVLNSTLPGGAPILTLALAIQVQGAGGNSTKIAVADVRMDRILKLVSQPGIAQIYLVDSEGKVLAHPDAAWVTERHLMSDNPIVRDAMDSPVTFQLRPFEWNNKRWLGGYSAVAIGGIKVISQVEETQAFRASKRLIDKSVLFALIILTASILISAWSAGTVTQPIQKLVEATEKLSRWEFNEGVHVKGRDEVARLARSFNAMAADLQAQRKQIQSNQIELERKVAERTHQLESQKRQVSETQETLVKTTRLASLGEMAGVAAHEILNPLNNINIRIQTARDKKQKTEKADIELFTDIIKAWYEPYKKGGWTSLQEVLAQPSREVKGKSMLEEDLENLATIARDSLVRQKETGEDFDFMTQEIMRVTRLINNMRSLSRVGGEKRSLDIHDPMDDTLLGMDPVFKKRNIQLVKDYGSESREHYTVLADKDELVQVFNNLIRNAYQAIDSAKRRAGKIQISTRKTGKRVEIRIIDNGTGITKEDLIKIFEPNFTTKDSNDGTGLGLSISRRLVRAFGGDVEIEKTVPGEGTTFLVWLPTNTG
ncbi:MAG: ATP-binding protein, partial [Bdellovibrionota bacterium]